MVLIVIYTSSVSKFTPNDKNKYSQVNGQVKKLQMVYGGDSIRDENAVIFAINKNDQIFIGKADKNSGRPLPKKVNWIMLPGLLNRGTAINRNDANIGIIGLNKNNELYVGVFKTNGAMVENWKRLEASENFSDVVDITFTSTGLTFLDKDGNIFSMQ